MLYPESVKLSNRYLIFNILRFLEYVTAKRTSVALSIKTTVVIFSVSCFPYIVHNLAQSVTLTTKMYFLYISETFLGEAVRPAITSSTYCVFHQFPYPQFPFPNRVPLLSDRTLTSAVVCSVTLLEFWNFTLRLQPLADRPVL